MTYNNQRAFHREPPILRYPTKKQNIIWLKRRQGLLPSHIADKMGVTRAFVSKASKMAEARIGDLIHHAAEINRIKLHHMSAAHGLAIGYCAPFKSESVITYSPALGIQVWFDHHGDCSSCADLNECTKLLATLSKEWKVPLTRNSNPTRLAQDLFKTIERRLAWID